MHREKIGRLAHVGAAESLIQREPRDLVVGNLEDVLIKHLDHF